MSNRDQVQEAAHQRVQRAIDNKLNDEQMIGYYDTWSQSYDHDMGVLAKAMREKVKAVAVEVLGDQKNLKVLDVACGTGFLAEVLQGEGYAKMDGIDGSAGMLKKAEESGLYNRLIHDFVGPNRLDIEDNTYDILICIGGISPTHIKDDCFDELLRITKPGGIITFAITLKTLIPVREKYEVTMQSFADAGRWDWQCTRILENYSQTSATDGDFNGIQYNFKKL